MAIILAYAHAKETLVGHVLPMVLEIPHDPECDFGALRWRHRTLLVRVLVAGESIETANTWMSDRVSLAI